MDSPLYRLYKTKLLLLGVVISFVGLAVLALPKLTGWTWLQGAWTTEVGIGLLFLGLGGVVADRINRRDAEERGHQELRQIIREEAPAIRDAVVSGFAFEPEHLARVASPETLDRVIRNCLAIRLDDAALAHDIYADVLQQVVRARNRCYDAKVSISLAPWEQGPASGPDSMFVATIRWQYQVVPPSPVMRFSCVSSEEEYRKLLQDPTSTTTWYFKPVVGLDGASKEVFALEQLAVNGVEQSIRRSERKGVQVYSVHLGPQSGAEAKAASLSYTFRALVRRDGHLLNLDIAQPTKGLKVEFFYGGCGISSVKALDYIASVEQPRISQLPSSAPTPSVSLAFDGWVWPKGGVGFVWSLAAEKHRRP